MEFSSNGEESLMLADGDECSCLQDGASLFRVIAKGRGLKWAWVVSRRPLSVYNHSFKADPVN